MAPDGAFNANPGAPTYLHTNLRNADEGAEGHPFLRPYCRCPGSGQPNRQNTRQVSPSSSMLVIR